MSTVGDTQYRGGYHDACGRYHDACGRHHDACVGYHEYLGVFSTMGDTIICNLSTVDDIRIQAGEYHVYHGACSVLWGYSNNKRFFPPTALMMLRYS